MRSLPSIFTSPALTLPPLRKLPPRPRVPFFKLASHTVPTKWSTYRRLLQYAPDPLHLEAVKSRWRRPRKRNCTGPHLTMRLLDKEDQILKDYIELHCLRSKRVGSSMHEISTPVQLYDITSLPAPAERASIDQDAEEPTPASSSLSVPYHFYEGLQGSTSTRLKSLQEYIEKLHLNASMSIKVTQDYVSFKQSRL